MLFDSYVPFVILAAVAVALFAYWLLKRRELKHLSPVIIAIIVSAAVTTAIYWQSLPLSGFLISSIAAAAVAAMLPLLYRKRPLAFMLALFVLAFGAAVSIDRAAMVGMFGVGTVIGMLYFDRFLAKRRENKEMRKTATEMKRDIVQMLIGLGVFVVMLLWEQNYFYILFWLILLGYLFNNMISRTGSAYRLLSRFERRDVEFGFGAIYIAAGLAILLGFAGFRLALFGVFPLFFGDSLATMTGMVFYRSRKLPWNRRKSVAGTAAFFIATVVPGAMLLGPWGIPLAFVLTVLESLNLPIDDNISVPIVTVVLGWFI